MNEVLIDNWGRSFTIPGVYSDFPPIFKLVHVAEDGTRTVYELLNEPVGWSELKFTMKRGELWGVNAEYTSSGTVLEFDQYSGRDVVESVFAVDGEDANLLFQAGIRVPEIIDAGSGIGVPGYDVIEYEGRLNLSIRKTEKRRFSGGLERATLQSRVEARWSSDVNLSASRSLDNAIITQPTFQTIVLTPQSLDERFTCNLLGSKQAEQTFPGDTNGHVWLQFDTSQPQISEIQELAGGRPMGLSDSEGPIENDEWLFKFLSAGTRQIKISLSYDLWFTVKKRTISFGAAKILGYRLDTFVTIVRTDGARQNYPITVSIAEGLGKTPPSGFAESEVSLTATGTLDTQIDIRADDKLFLYGLLWFSHNKNELQSTQVSVRTKTQRISITGRSTNNSSTARCLPVYDAMNAALTVMTGLSDRFRSAFYGQQGDRYATDGCGAKRVVFNGFAARNFKPLERPLSTSFQDLVTGFGAIDCMGLQYGFELDDDGNPVEIVTMNPIGDFFRPVELMRFDEVGDYGEESIAGEIYSQVNCGYETWVDDGSNSLEEVFTTHQLTTPIKHESAVKPILSKLVASSLAIEQTRREQFADTPKDGTSFDEKIFVVQCKNTPSYHGAATITLTIVGATIQLPTAIDWLTVGMQISISGTASADGLFTVGYVSDLALRPWSFIVNEGIDSQVLTDLTIQPYQGLGLVPETGADLAQVTGLQSPNDTYNLRLTPGRMLWNNVPIWAGCLINKDKLAAINKVPITETGQISVTFAQLFLFNAILTNQYVDWLALGMTVTITGSVQNDGTYTVVGVAPADYHPWMFFVKETLTAENAPSVNIAFESISTTNLYEAANKTKIPNNKSVVTALEPGDPCGRSGLVSESAPMKVDELIPSLLFVPRLIRFKRRLSHREIQRLRLGHMGMLPTEMDDNGDPIDRNYGYISLLDERGIRVAGWLNSVEYSRDNEEAVFELRQCALDLNDTTSGLDCAQFAGWTLAQAMAADERTRRRIELCRFIDVDPL